MAGFSQKCEEKHSIGFIGLGRMGFPMCARLINAGYTVFAYSATEKTRKRAEEIGATALNNPGEIAKNANIIMLCLPTSQVVEEVIYNEDGLLRHLAAGSVIIDLGSSDPLSTKRIATDLAKQQCILMDAPVSRGVPAAISGTLSMMVGGEEAVFERVKNILGHMATDIFYMGDVGSGHTVKCLNNLLSASNLISALEVTLLAKKLNIDPEKFLHVVSSSSGSSLATSDRIPRHILSRNFNSQFALDLMYKDVKTALNLADSLGTPMFLTSVTKELYAMAMQKNMGKDDNTRLGRLLEELTNTDLTGRG